MPPPTQAKGCAKFGKCKRDRNELDVLTWKAPSNSSSVVAYRIYRDRSLSKLIGTVSSEDPLKFKDCRRHKRGKVNTYFIVSVDEFDNVSEPIKVKVKRPCRMKFGDDSKCLCGND